MLSELENTISVLSEVQGTAVELVHGVRGTRGRSRWEAFAPSRFVYAFFAFNSIYSQCDWKRSIETGDFIKMAPNSKGRIPSETKQIKAVLEQMSEGQSSRELAVQYRASVLAELAKSHNTCFEERGLTSIGDSMIFVPPGGGPLRSPDAVADIVPDPPGGLRRNITEDRIDAFKDAWCRLLKDDAEQWYDDLRTLNIFIYRVRCNVFHGNKRITEVVEKAQQRRFLVYASLLLATNQIFLRNVSSRMGLDLYSSSLPVVVDVPAGDLFYPCSGRDLIVPIRMLSHVCNQLHFADPRSRHPGQGQRRRVVCHGGDAVSVLDTLSEPLSVFFYRRDSTGDGSGIMWLQDRLLERVLEKMIDGGLVITDGCNGYQGEQDGFTQEPLWRDFNKDKPQGQELPRDFSFKGRRFTCRGRLLSQSDDNGYGPTYVWQILSD